MPLKRLTKADILAGLRELGRLAEYFPDTVLPAATVRVLENLLARRRA